MRAPSPVETSAQNTACISVFNFQAVFSDSGRRFSAKNGCKTPPEFLFLIFRRCFQTAGAASRRKMGAKHRLDVSFSLSGGVFRARAPLPGAKWAQNTAWFSVLDFQAVFLQNERMRRRIIRCAYESLPLPARIPGPRAEAPRRRQDKQKSENSLSRKYREHP